MAHTVFPSISEPAFEQRLLLRINQFRAEKSDAELSKRIQKTDDEDPEDIRIRLISKVRYQKQTTDNGGALWERGHFFPCAMKLINAAKAGRLAQIKKLLRGGHAINARDSEGRVSLDGYILFSMLSNNCLCRARCSGVLGEARAEHPSRVRCTCGVSSTSSPQYHVLTCASSSTCIPVPTSQRS